MNVATAIRPERLPSKEPTLLEALTSAVQAIDAETAFLHEERWQGPSDTTDIELADARFDTRQALYQALSRHGIDARLAGRIGEVLL